MLLYTRFKTILTCRQTHNGKKNMTHNSHGSQSDKQITGCTVDAKQVRVRCRMEDFLGTLRKLLLDVRWCWWCFGVANVGGIFSPVQCQAKLTLL